MISSRGIIMKPSPLPPRQTHRKQTGAHVKVTQVLNNGTRHQLCSNICAFLLLRNGNVPNIRILQSNSCINGQKYHGLPSKYEPFLTSKHFGIIFEEKYLMNIYICGISHPHVKFQIQFQNFRIAVYFFCFF